jgi:hypothetical protein
MVVPCLFAASTQPPLFTFLKDVVLVPAFPVFFTFADIIGSAPVSTSSLVPIFTSAKLALNV